MSGPFQRIIKYYTDDMGLRKKLTISHLVVVIIPLLLVSIFLYSSFYDMVIKNMIASEQTLSVQTSDTLKATLSQAVYAANSILDSQVTRELFQEERDLSAVEEVDEQKIANYYQTILAMTDQELITDIRIYYDAPYHRLSDFNMAEAPVFQPLERMTSSYWYGILSTTEEESLFCPSLYLSPTEIRENGELAYMTRVPYGKGEKDAAFIAVYFSKEKIQNILSQNITVNDSAAYLLNEKSTLIAASDAALTGEYFTELDRIKELTQTENNFVTAPFLEQKIYLGYHVIDNSDWYMISVIPSSTVMQKGKVLIFQFLGLYLLVVILAFIVAYRLSGSFVKRISTVVKQMQKVRLNRPERIQSVRETKDEIGNLVHTYNYMTDEINSLLELKEKTAKELRLTEFSALQAQINPHFLYNSLDMINWHTQKGEKEEAGKAIQALSKFYKLTLSKKNAAVTMETELEHVSLYVELQNMRYDDKIGLLIDIPPDMLSLMIPRLTFQPIVENAILHGIMRKPEKQGNIVITGWREGTDLVCLISDDGVGMEPEVLKRILTGEKHADESRAGKSGTGEDRAGEVQGRRGTGIGVYNTHRRLQLLYGASYGLTYESTVDQGTDVYIRIPEMGADYEEYHTEYHMEKAQPSQENSSLSLHDSDADRDAADGRLQQ